MAQLSSSKGQIHKQVKKLEPQVIQAAAALGLDVRKFLDNAISFDIELPTPSGNQRVKALLDSSAQMNLVSTLWAKKYDLPMDSSPQRIKALDGHCVTSYGWTTLPVIASDQQGIMKQSMQHLDTVNMDDFDIILGFPWLQDVNLIVNWQLMTWAYKEGQISNNYNIISEKKVTRAL